ncbi:type II toxin-antitoxin system VapC family toxin [Thiobacter aerophilum]|uniref:Type II toxin-antitoxin system VapC family toxin n=1 Tax=Thiobacter aerophilum TaxID=3121275 RepID=A0ABV0EHF0_9BURK
MAEVVIDTNVLLVASQRHHDVSPQCVLACIERLERIQKNECVVIDKAFEILGEYQRKLDTRTGKGPGEAFLKWLLQNKANPNKVHQVALTKHADHDYAEFPDPALADQFDPPDRKYVAVAYAHPSKPPVLQAADSKWLRWQSQLQAHGIRVEFPCPQDIRRFFQKKFPGEVPPPL